jgi:hypothetical protein
MDPPTAGRRRARTESSGFATPGQSQRDFEPFIPSLSAFKRFFQLLAFAR